MPVEFCIGLLPPTVLPGARDKFGVAEGGRFDESSRWRAVIPELLENVDERPAFAELFELNPR